MSFIRNNPDPYLIQPIIIVAVLLGTLGVEAGWEWPTGIVLITLLWLSRGWRERRDAKAATDVRMAGLDKRLRELPEFKDQHAELVRQEADFVAKQTELKRLAKLKPRSKK